MKVISLLQPWASLVVLGHKKIETRSWNTKYRGELLIHASANAKMAKSFVNIDSGDNEFRKHLRHWTDLPFGAIIGKVNVVETQPTSFFIDCSAGIPLKKNGKYSADEWAQEIAFGDYGPGRYGWLLSEPEIFEEPIPAKGKLGLWEFNL